MQEFPNDLGYLKDKAIHLRQQMIDLQYKLNENQLGVSLFAAYQFQQGVHRQIYAIPAGQGKSRVIVGIIAAMNYDLTTKRQRGAKPRKYVVLYNHDLQMQDDEDKLDATKVGSRCNVEYEVVQFEQEFSPDPYTIYIIDEVDAVLLDKKISFSKLPKIIGVTATARIEFKGLEKNYIEDALGFTIFDSKIAGNCPEIGSIARSEWSNYFTANKTMAFLAYIEEKDLKSVRDYATACV